MPTETKSHPETRGRPTLYKGIRMRSRTEADYAAYLDRRGHLWEYEPECFADENGQWLPDFRITKAGRRGEDGRLIEVKPAEMLKPAEGECDHCVIRHVDAIIDKVRTAWTSEPAATIEIVFWKYGASMPVLGLIGALRQPWMVDVPGHFNFPLLWAGAGQADTLSPSPEVAAGTSPDEGEGSHDR